MRAFIAAILLFLPLAAPAAEEPDAVYAKYHRAAFSGDLAEVARYSPAAQRAEFASMSPAQKDASVKMLRASLPRAFILRNKTVAPDGRTARLVVSGEADSPTGGKPEQLYGSIRLVLEDGEWRVAEAEWNNTPPAALSTPAPRPAPAAAQKPAAPAHGGGSVVGSTSSGPQRTWGQAKEPCVYKPVMTAEDLEKCR